MDIGDSAERAILDLEESHTADLKSVDISPAKLTRSLSAFANAEGGELFIGIDEDAARKVRVWRGFSNLEAANAHVQVLESTFPLDEFVDWQFLRLPTRTEAGLVLKVSILKTPDIRRSSDGSVYIRRGAQNLPVANGEPLQRLEYQKGVRSFETHPVDVPVEMIADSLVTLGFLTEVVPSVANAETWLRKQLLIRADKPTVASIVLFADEPQAALPKQSSVKIYRYASSAAEGTRATMQGLPVTVEGCAYDVIRDAVRTAVDIVQSIRIMGSTGLESISYPEVTLHEIITNAVLHRDYSIADDIHVRIFDNRVEVESPGGLPAHLTPANILTQRFARNGTIVRWINKFPDPPNKDVGEGLNTAFEAMRDLKLRPPQVIDKGTSVLVDIRHQRLASPEEFILEYLGSHAEISNSVVRELTGIGSENTVKRIFKRMIRAGAIEPIPDRSLRDAAYRLPAGEGGVSSSP